MFRYQISSSLKLKNSNRQPLVVNIKKCSKLTVTYCIEKGKSRRIKGRIPNRSDGWVLGCFCPKRGWWAHPCLHCALGCVFWFFSELPILPLKSKSGNHPLSPPCLRVKSLASCFGYRVLFLSPPLVRMSRVGILVGGLASTGASLFCKKTFPWVFALVSLDLLEGKGSFGSVKCIKSCYS